MVRSAIIKNLLRDAPTIREVFSVVGFPLAVSTEAGFKDFMKQDRNPYMISRFCPGGKRDLEKRSVEVSIIIPVKDEEANIEVLAGELLLVLDEQPWSWECIWVDDGSEDNSLAAIKRLVKSDGRFRYIAFEENAGNSAALWAGFNLCRGPIIVTLDGDGQNDPADIPHFVEAVRSGKTDMVQGYRKVRKDSLVRRLSARTGNTFRSWMTGRNVRDTGCATRAFKKDCLRNLPLFSGMHRFLPTLVAMQGYRLSELQANHRPRMKGRSKFNIRNRLWVGIADTLGVLWLKRRRFQYAINEGSENANEKRSSL